MPIETTAADNLAIALSKYRAEFEKILQIPPNDEAEHAREIIQRANAFVRASGLGQAIDTLIEDIKFWPSWSKQPNFIQSVHFPVSDVLATEEVKVEKKARTSTATISFTYENVRYGIVLTDEGSTLRMDGDGSYQHGKIDFLANEQIVLGLNIAFDGHDNKAWHWFSVYVLKMNNWAKHLLEMAEHIKVGRASYLIKFREDEAIKKAKNISF